MHNLINMSVEGHIKAIDRITGDVFMDIHNDILYGNMSTALAHALLGNPNSFAFYMGFGNGAAYVSPTGTISYRESLGGPSSMIKMPDANLYNTIYVKRMSNDSTPASSYDTLSRIYSPSENYAVNYEDITAEVTLLENEPAVNLSPIAIQQLDVDNSTFVGTGTASLPTANTFVFNEMALFAGSSNLLSGNATVTTDEITDFINQTPNFSRDAGVKSKIMLTHAVFHPKQKAANVALDFFYTVRIKMGVL